MMRNAAKTGRLQQNHNLEEKKKLGDNDVTIEQKSVRPHLTIILSLQ